MANLRSLLPATAFVLLLAAGCAKNNDAAPDDSTPDESMSAEVTQAGNATDEITAMQDEALATSALTTYKVAGTYPIITRQARNSANPDTLTIDFGPTNYLCADGRNRRGKVQAIYNNPLSSTTNSYVATPNAYYVNDYQLSGSVNAVRATTSRSWALTVNLTLTAPAGGTITYQLTGTRTQVAGETTAAVADDVFLTNATASTTGTLGYGYSTTLTDVRRPAACRHAVSGTISLRRAAATQRGVDINYGTGTCDDTAQATLQPSGRVLTVTLR